MSVNAKGKVPESWDCIDCGANTAPGFMNREQIEQAFTADPDATINQTIDDASEVYMVRPAVWTAAGMSEMGGCLCIGCLETRIGRKLRPKDFLRKHAFAELPGTDRLLDRRGGQPRPLGLAVANWLDRLRHTNGTWPQRPEQYQRLVALKVTLIT